MSAMEIPKQKKSKIGLTKIIKSVYADSIRGKEIDRL